MIFLLIICLTHLCGTLPVVVKIFLLLQIFSETYNHVNIFLAPPPHNLGSVPCKRGALQLKLH
jgi:hypothetical protein